MFARYLIKIKLTTLSLLIVIGCAGPQLVEPELKTLRPEGFEKKIVELNQNAVLDSGILKIIRVQREHAELRKGPGARFGIQDDVLKRGHKGILIEAKGVWRKIISIDGELSGWLHKKSIVRHYEKEKIKISFDRLPVVVAIRDVNRMYDYKDISLLNVKIPKGTPFIAFQKHKWRTLVWLPQTNSLAWVSQKDFR